MSGRTDVDDLLRGWLSDGSERAPDRHVLAALERIDAVPQDRSSWLRDLLAPGGDGPSLLRMGIFGAAGAVLLLAFGLVIGGQVGNILEPPPPVPSATAPISERELETFVAVDGSFEIRLPEAWRLGVGPDSTATYLRTATFEFSIRAGDAGGSLVTCDTGAGPWETCELVAPTSLDELAESVGLTSAEEGGAIPVGPVRTSTTLDGEPARVERIEAYEYPARGAESVTYITAMHDGRPYILRLWFPGAEPADLVLDVVVAGFTFLPLHASPSAAEASESPSPSPSTSPDIGQPATADADAQLELFSNPDEGYEILLPRIWAGSPQTVTQGEQEATAFGSGRGAGTRGNPALVITIGDADGTITVCSPTCAAVTITSLSELEDEVVSTPSFFTSGPPERHGDLVLGGEDARYESAGIGNNCLGCPDAYYHVYTIHEGRPVVLAFDYWTVRFASIAAEPRDLRFTPSSLNAILESFRFIEDGADSPGDGQPESVDGFRTFVAPDGSFEVRLPEAWKGGIRPGADRGRLFLYRGATQVSIRAGDADGRILTCDEPQGPWEECVTSTPRTLAELGRDITLTPTAVEGIGPNGPTRSDAVLDGEPARIERIEAYEYPAKGGEWVTYVAAMHEGRPFVIRFWSPASSPDTAVEEILAGFQFLDE